MTTRRKAKKSPTRSRVVRKADGTPVPPPVRHKRSSPQHPQEQTAALPYPDHPTVSVCMIVKNEEELLANCLGSIKDLADEIVIVDTGSTDRTVEIARSYGARIYHFEWRNDFSAARNVSIEYCTGDWICIIDADEELVAEDLPALKKTLYTTEYRALSISVYNYSQGEALYTSFLPSVRFFRRETMARYEGIVHNMLRLPENEEVLRSPVRFCHYGYGLSKEKMAKKVERTKSMLLQQLEENPDYGFAHFNMAQILRGEQDVPTADQMERVVYHAGRAVELSDPHKPGERHIHLMGSHQLVTAYFNKGDYKNAEKWCHYALSLLPDYLDPLLSLGHIYSSTRQLELARKYYLEYLDRQLHYDEHAQTEYIILMHLHSRHNAYYGLGLVAQMEDKHAEAAGWYEKCLGERDDYLDAHYRLGLMYYQLGEYDQARRHWERQLELVPTDGKCHVFLGEVLHRQGNIRAAETHLHRALELSEANTIACYRLAIIEQERGGRQQALEYISRMLRFDPGFSEGYRLRGDIYFDLEDYPAAALDYERCLNELPADCRLLNNLGNCRFHQGDYAAAEELYRRAAGLAPEFGEALRNWGISLARLERIDDACVALAEYVQRHNDDVAVKGFLGDLYCRLDDLQAAITCYESVVAAGPVRADVWTRLADCYHSQGCLDAALMGYQKALKIDPEHQPTLERLREIREHLVQQKQFQEAKAEAEGRLVRA
jgi:tetratricopeptide (TPR) repeat protein